MSNYNYNKHYKKMEKSTISPTKAENFGIQIAKDGILRSSNEILTQKGVNMDKIRKIWPKIPFFNKEIELKKIRKNDLIFWKGHVAIAISNRKLIHAYGPLKKTLTMPIDKTIDRIYKTANLKVIGVRRIA